MSSVNKTLNPAGSFLKGPKYIEDYFNVTCYLGNGSSSRDIVTGIDLSEGNHGMVLIAKMGTSGMQPRHFDTMRGANVPILTTSSGVPAPQGVNELISFNSDGFTVGNDADVNQSGQYYTAVTFKKVEGFFDIVEYSGNNAGSHAISHNLGYTPAMIWVMSNGGYGTTVQHRMMNAGGGTTYQNYYTQLQTASITDNVAWSDTQPTDKYFTVGKVSQTNNQYHRYIAYLWANHAFDAGDFGENGDESVCTSFTGNWTGGTTDRVVEAGFSPDFLYNKSYYTYSYDHVVTTRNGYGCAAHSSSYSPQHIELNTTSSTTTAAAFLSDGILLNSTSNDYNRASTRYYGTAIGGVQKPITSVDEAFTVTAYSGTNVDRRLLDIGLNADTVMIRHRSTVDNSFNIIDKHSSGAQYFFTTGPNSHSIRNDADTFMSPTSSYNMCPLNHPDSICIGNDATYKVNNSGSKIAYAWKRAPKFYDAGRHKGSGSVKTVKHNLKVVPEMIWTKSENSSGDWAVYHKDLNGGTNPEQYYLRLHTNAAEIDETNHWNDTAPTSTEITVGTDYDTNRSGYLYNMYYFATLDGMSKVGSYTGTGGNITVDCGFTSGTKFLLIKRADSTGDWYVFDSERGITTGSVPYLRVNLSNAELSGDIIDPDDSGFIVTSSAPAALNASGGRYIFYAIAQ